MTQADTPQDFSDPGEIMEMMQQMLPTMRALLAVLQELGGSQTDKLDGLTKLLSEITVVLPLILDQQKLILDATTTVSPETAQLTEAMTALTTRLHQQEAAQISLTDQMGQIIQILQAAP